MGKHEPIRVVARLASPLCGEAPQLDALLENAMAINVDPAMRGADRSAPAPAPGNIPIGISRNRIGGWPVACSSSPIVGPAIEDVDHICKRIEPDHAGLLDPSARRKLATTNSWTKSYRLPFRVRTADAVVWFAYGEAKVIRKLLRRKVDSIGAKRSAGYGRVAEWEAEPWHDDWSWFAPTPHGRMLMRPLPLAASLPGDLIGSRRDFGACCGPYWHPERYTEIIAPC